MEKEKPGCPDIEASKTNLLPRIGKSVFHFISQAIETISESIRLITFQSTGQINERTSYRENRENDLKDAKPEEHIVVKFADCRSHHSKQRRIRAEPS